MKTILVLVVMLFSYFLSIGQSADPRRSSKTAAEYDAACIDANIADSRDLIYFSQMGIDRGSKTETIELAQDLLTDFTEILYSMEQLAVAGSGSSSQNPGNGDGSLAEVGVLNDKLSLTRGLSFDTAWLGGLLRLHQAKYADFTEQKEKATNGRLKAAVTSAMPLVKKHMALLNTLQKRLIKQNEQEKKEAARREKA